ncbi:FecCD family ABC transporter permease [Actinopolyspora mortivallis]|uniref:ABC transporter permease n=1 Tax=Actinopolyspora mortivallis TaxID=33906 RepID=A0A2T0GZA3_ACTMO|nr:iron ABC transporter permease [Actinopolyspora mortivallis]PRW64363.1 ABC transporter permease [Actinopolyspora mortivallis]
MSGPSSATGLAHSPGSSRGREHLSTLRPTHVLYGVVALVGVSLFSVLLGAADLGWHRVLAEIGAQVTGGISPLSEREAAILWQLRVPRVVLAALVGGALAISGAAFQGVFRNPLAEPYLLGAAAGAGLSVTVMAVTVPHIGLGTTGVTQLAAFGGALGGVMLTWLIGRSAGPETATLVLAGVAVGAFLTAAQTFVQQLRVESLQRVYMWILGDLSTAGWGDVLVVLPTLLPALVVLCACARLLDLLGVGDEEAATLGIRPGRVRALVLAAASLATAAAVSVSGLIGFVGLVVPHLVRLTSGGSYRVIVPLSVMFGASFLVAADTLARTLMAPAELPIGVVTAFTGAPFFAFLLRTNRAR